MRFRANHLFVAMAAATCAAVGYSWISTPRPFVYNVIHPAANHIGVLSAVPSSVTITGTDQHASGDWSESNPRERPEAEGYSSQTPASNHFSAIQCLRLGVRMAQNDGLPEAKNWISEGLQKAILELASAQSSDPSIRPLLQALSDAQNRLQGRVDAAILLEQINGLIMRFDRAQDWDQTPEWARIHHADALVLERRFMEAQSEAADMSRDSQIDGHWTTQEKEELDLVIARIPFAPEATSALDILQRHKPLPRDLIAWIERRIRVSGSQPGGHAPAYPSDSVALTILVRQGNLSAAECLRIGQLLADSNLPMESEVFANVGVDRTATMLDRIASGDRAALPLINALKSTEARLWDLGCYAEERGVTIEKINSILVRFDRSDRWDQTPEWALISHGEALYMQHRYPEALAEADKLSHEAQTGINFTDEQKLGIHWLRAIVLFDSHRFDEAGPELRQVATHPFCLHSSEAWPLWAISLAKTGHADEANRAFDDWIRKCRPALNDASRVLGIINGMDADQSKHLMKSKS